METRHKTGNDSFVMDKIINTVKSSTVLARLNDVILYLKVSRLSDISTADGLDIHQWAMYGPPSNSTLQ